MSRMRIGNETLPGNRRQHSSWRSGIRRLPAPLLTPKCSFSQTPVRQFRVVIGLPHPPMSLAGEQRTMRRISHSDTLAPLSTHSGYHSHRIAHRKPVKAGLSRLHEAFQFAFDICDVQLISFQRRRQCRATHPFCKSEWIKHRLVPLRPKQILFWRRHSRLPFTTLGEHAKPITQRVGASDEHLAAHAVTLRLDASDP